ncbi:glutamate--tRNA ligase [Buchnera aphidicola]|uniref:glutamate--tRNA ligase n=1 Tax=Buchnera aphidicola TaxID=9 RepID=UPI0020930060|nr:glutamate--tRNA ligase [Buchnera aphidicola]USS94182.1 glutamate--tRNA ligase [Buchnera aphidicola (Sipha maydis)]
MLIKTRFAPSPSGELHFGNIRTALYSWLYAKQNNGVFILRIEDTDTSRSCKKFSKNIIDTLKWLKLNWNEGPYFQSKKIHRYQEIINFMLSQDLAYKCYCGNDQLNYVKKIQSLRGIKTKYNGACRNLKKNLHTLQKYVVRFKNPLSGEVTFHDMIRGKIVVKNIELDDLIIQRENGIPTYNFCVVIDDMDSEITHVIRGEDHINNTPRQINILNALGAKIPNYAHLSMILNSNKKNLSKRNNLLSVLKYKKLGYLPEAILNYIVRLGWSRGNKEIFSLKEMIDLFNFKSMTKSSSVFDGKKLLWINKYYINSLKKSKITNLIIKIFKKKNIDFTQGPRLSDVISVFSSRVSTILDLFHEVSFFYKDIFIEYDKKYLNNYFNLQSLKILRQSYKEFLGLSNWNMQEIFQIIKKLSIRFNVLIKDIIYPMRVALVGKSNSIGINKVMFFLGKEKSLSRLKNFLNIYNEFFL